jgi:hypothetical protein
LRKMLDSVNSQTVHIELYMSVSGLDDQIVKELQARHAQWLHMTKSGCAQMSQFQHYKLLCEEVSERFNSSNTWCMFTDDDDVWHARRAESYLEQIRGSRGLNSYYFLLYLFVNSCITYKINDLKDYHNNRLTRYNITKNNNAKCR